MDVTVAICTWNRAGLLDKTLARLQQVVVPAELKWELLVVDNNCTDDTQTVLAKHRDRLPLKPLVETKQGHSHARNRAVAEARGKLLIWTDDDVLIAPNWLGDLTAAATKHAEAVFFGGPVRPWYERTPPAWITRHLPRITSVWALLDHGPEVRPLTSTEYCFGANIAFRMDVLRRYPFDPDYGRVKTRLTGGDETRVIDQIRKDGWSGVWVGPAAVDHFLPADRMTVRYIFDFYRWASYQGVAAFAKDTSPRSFGAPRWMWKKYFAASLKAKLRSVSKDEVWLDSLLEAAKWRGLIDRFRAVRKVRS